MKQFKHLIKPYIIWASILIVVPLILIVLYAFTSDGNEVLTLHFTWANFAKFLEATYLSVILKSFRLGILTTLICLVCGYPLAYIISKYSEKVQSFLRQEGYRLPEAGEVPDVGNMLTQLSRKLCCSAEFPHEIGVFLGYPLGDVVGFIENRGKNFTCCGCWKSYGDPDAAQKHFDQLSKCTAVYLRLFHSGTPILRLAVAA